MYTNFIVGKSDRKEKKMKYMKKHLQRITVIALLLMTAALIGSVPSAEVKAGVGPAKDWRFETVTPPPELTPGANCNSDVNCNVQAVYINNDGLMVVQYQYPIPIPYNFLEQMHTAVVQQGEWKIIDVPGAASTGTANANSRGEIALTYFEPSQDYELKNMIYQWGTYTPFPFPGITGYVMLDSINDRGQVAAGVFADTAHVQSQVGHGLIGTGADYTIFDYPSSGGSEVINTLPFGINNDETVVGYYQLSDFSYHAFLYDFKRDAFANIDIPESLGTLAVGINNGGEIVGAYIDQNGNMKGFLLRGGHYTDVIVPGAVETVPYGINDRGQITGTYVDSSGGSHGFVATPTPGSR